MQGLSVESARTATSHEARARTRDPRPLDVRLDGRSRARGVRPTCASIDRSRAGLPDWTQPGRIRARSRSRVSSSRRFSLMTALPAPSGAISASRYFWSPSTSTPTSNRRYQPSTQTSLPSRNRTRCCSSGGSNPARIDETRNLDSAADSAPGSANATTCRIRVSDLRSATASAASSRRSRSTPMSSARSAAITPSSKGEAPATSTTVRQIVVTRSPETTAISSSPIRWRCAVRPCRWRSAPSGIVTCTARSRGRSTGSPSSTAADQCENTRGSGDTAAAARRRTTCCSSGESDSNAVRSTQRPGPMRSSSPRSASRLIAVRSPEVRAVPRTVTISSLHGSIVSRSAVVIRGWWRTGDRGAARAPVEERLAGCDHTTRAGLDRRTGPDSTERSVESGTERRSSDGSGGGEVGVEAAGAERLLA